MNIYGVSAIYRSAARCMSVVGLYTSYRNFSFTFARPTRNPMDDILSHVCSVDAEPLHRYKTGGYHPVSLGDQLHDGRYRILHKLGWGGYSTVWAAKDQREQKYVAIKICASELGEEAREIKVLSALAAIRSGHPGAQHLVPMLDHFQVHGPNGTHHCLVLEFLGPSVPDLLDRRIPDERLPGKLAKSIAKQALLALDYLHEQEIGHGDLHTRNLIFTIPHIHALEEDEFFRKLKPPEIGQITRMDGKPLEPGMPEYLVRPASYPVALALASCPIKLVDFGETFMSNDIPGTLHTPLPVRAPEIIFGDKLDYRVDLWSMGCMLFELVVGQPPFDSGIPHAVLVRQMLDTVGEELPERWQRTLREMDSACPGERSGQTLQEWLEETYFDGEREEDLTREDIIKVGELVRRMLRFEPSDRASAKEILQDPWFHAE